MRGNMSDMFGQRPVGGFSHFFHTSCDRDDDGSTDNDKIASDYITQAPWGKPHRPPEDDLAV